MLSAKQLTSAQPIKTSNRRTWLQYVAKPANKVTGKVFEETFSHVNILATEASLAWTAYDRCRQHRTCSKSRSVTDLAYPHEPVRRPVKARSLATDKLFSLVVNYWSHSFPLSWGAPVFVLHSRAAVGQNDTCNFLACRRRSLEYMINPLARGKIHQNPRRCFSACWTSLHYCRDGVYVCPIQSEKKGYFQFITVWLPCLTV